MNIKDIIQVLRIVQLQRPETRPSLIYCSIIYDGRDVATSFVTDKELILAFDREHQALIDKCNEAVILYKSDTDRYKLSHVFLLNAENIHAISHDFIVNMELMGSKMLTSSKLVQKLRYEVYNHSMGNLLSHGL